MKYFNYNSLKYIARKLNGLNVKDLKNVLNSMQDTLAKKGIVVGYYDYPSTYMCGYINEDYLTWDKHCIHFQEDGKYVSYASLDHYYPIIAHFEKGIWYYDFEPAHESFDVYKSGRLICKGIIFFVFDIKKTPLNKNEQIIQKIDTLISILNIREQK